MKKRGEVWWVNFDPSVGQEVRKKDMMDVERIIRIQLGL